jgi:hypothetical protein
MVERSMTEEPLLRTSGVGPLLGGGIKLRKIPKYSNLCWCKGLHHNLISRNLSEELFFKG